LTCSSGLVIALALLAPSAASATALPGTIKENMTLTPAGNPYIAETVTIESGATVTVEPGVQVIGNDEFSRIFVSGTLKAEGTAEKPVIFTSEGAKEPGEWRGLVFEPGSGGSILDHVEVAYGGHLAKPMIEINSSSPTILNSTLRKSDNEAIYVTKGGSPNIGNNDFIKNDLTAIRYFGTKESTGEINIHGNYVEGGSTGISAIVESGASITGKTLSGNTVIGTEGTGVFYSGSDVPGDITENTLSGNKFNRISIEGTVAHTSAWPASPGGTPLWLPGTLTVTSGVTLTMSPGVLIVGGDEFSRIHVHGSLKVEGTEEEPVVFTSAESKEVGEWRGLVFEPGSGGSILDHVEVAYGGHLAKPMIEINSSSPTITNSTFLRSDNQAIYIPKGGSPNIGNNDFINNDLSAIWYIGTKESTGEINIHGNYVEGGGSGISATVESGASIAGKTLSGNTVIGTNGTGIFYNGNDIPGDITENTLSGNKNNRISVEGTVASSSTWNASLGGTPLWLPNTLTVASGVTLSVKPGVNIIGGDEFSRVFVNGSLKAEGTAEKPVIFTSAGSKEVGEWRGLVFNSGSGGSVLDHVEIGYGGHLSVPMIEIVSSSPTITNSTFLRSDNQAIYIPKGGSPDIANNDFFSNDSTAIRYIGPKGSTGEINIHGNYIEGGGSGISATVESGASITGKTLSSNTVIGTNGTGVLYGGSDIPGDITDNTLIGNKSNRISVEGTVAHSSTWNPSGTAPLWLPSTLSISSGKTLTVKPGVNIIGSDEFSRIFVAGTLKAEGTAEKPVVFTSTNSKEAGEWRGLVFESGSGGSILDHVEVAYGGHLGKPMIEIVSSSPTIKNSTMRKSDNQGIKATGSSSPKIERNRFRDNDSGLSYTGTGKLAASNNDWGCANGPQPAGCGDSVTSNINWKPAISLPELGGHCRGKESQCPEDGDPVSLATGQLSYSHRDLLLTNKSSTPLEFVRSYTSGSESDTGLGPGWSQTGLASATELESGEVLILREDGRQDLFTKTETGYKAPSGVTDTLAKIEGTFRLTTLQNTVYAFDSSGRIASVTDDHGLKTTYGYNAEGRLATITDPSAQTLTFSYNASNHITLVKDSTGREVKFAYSAAGDLETVTDALGGVTKYGYDAQHRMTSITDPRSNVILKNVYDGQGRIVEQKDGLENLWKLKYKEGETIVTEPEGGELTYEFDGQDRVVSETDQLGNKTTTGYDAAGNVDEVVKSGGAKWTLGYDAAGNLTSAEDPEGGEREYEYDGQNRLTDFTDARGNAWSYEWSEANDLTKVTNPEGGETTFTYNASGQPLTVVDPNEHKTEFSYDLRGNQLTATDPLSHKTSFEYNSRNHMTAKTLPGLKAESYERNALGDLLARTTPEGNKTKYVYDGNGMPTQITDPAENVWKISYNAMERPTAYTDPLEQQTKVAYDGNLKPTKVTNRRGKETTYGYDLANQLTEVDRPEGGDWIFDYDNRGNRSSVIDPRENETTYEYDLLDRMTEADEPLGTSTEYGYDAGGELTSVTDPRENETTYEYDKLGRLVEVAQPLEKTTTYSYDAVGNPLTKVTAAGTLEYGYDAANRLSSIKAGEATLRSFGYDAADRLTGATDAESHKIEIGYDNDSRVTSIKDGRGQSLTRAYNSRALLTKQVDGRGTLEYGYDKLGRMTSLTDPQGKALSFAYDPEGGLTEIERPNGVTTTNVYDDAGRLAETTSEDESSTVLEALEYGYDAAGNVLSRFDSRLEQETSFGYDPLNRLTAFNPPGEGATAYGYDTAGNRVEAGATTYKYNALNQLTSASDGTTYSYDSAGRMTGMENESEETTYEWDLFDHLAKAEGPTGTASYSFDALERLSERKSGKSTQVMHYGDLTDRPTYDTDGEGETIMSYMSGPRGLLEQRSGEATSYPLADAHGDITAITGPTGNVESRQAYDPWGTQLSGPSLELGWLGAQQRRSDGGTGLVQMGIRSYDPTLGAFLTEDPVLGHVGIGMTVDRYLYALNNPLNRYDLNGRDVCVFGGCVGSDDVAAIREDIEGGLGIAEEGVNAVGSAAGSAADDVWDWTAPGRGWISDRAQDFWKKNGSTITSIYRFAGGNWQTCVQGASAGAAAGFVIGSPVPGVGNGAGAAIGGVGGCVGLVGAKEGISALAK